MIQEIFIKSSEFQAKNEFLLVKPQEAPKETVTESGIILALHKSVLDVPTSGTVINLGQDIKDIKEGDFVMWPNTDGIDIKFNDGEFKLLRYKSIIGSKKNV